MEKLIDKILDIISANDDYPIHDLTSSTSPPIDLNALARKNEKETVFKALGIQDVTQNRKVQVGVEPAGIFSNVIEIPIKSEESLDIYSFVEKAHRKETVDQTDLTYNLLKESGVCTKKSE